MSKVSEAKERVVKAARRWRAANCCGEQDAREIVVAVDALDAAERAEREDTAITPPTLDELERHAGRIAELWMNSPRGSTASANLYDELSTAVTAVRARRAAMAPKPRYEVKVESCGAHRVFDGGVELSAKGLTAALNAQEPRA